ncbi:MAG: MFS transporter [Austwickia sp.]|mgnify:CR=1 FL=1|nr:MFS transporter [Austwickia sp.]MBK8437159.1 MFS transporter [Austwickia sp.]MBK9102393.1 MFS transporter [Austwickia sp.]
MRARSGVVLLAGVLTVTLVLRAPITSVPPALPVLATALGLGPVGAGLVTSLPLICFGVFAFLTPRLAARYGAERTLWLAVAVLLLGQLVRPFGGVVPFFAGTLLLGIGIAVGNVIVPAIARARFAHRLAPVMGGYAATINLSGAAGAFATAPLLGLGWTWPWAIGVWILPTALALGWWTVGLRVMRRYDAAGPGRVRTPPASLATLAARPLTWAIALVMGLQSLVFYSLVAWIPLIMIGHGMNTQAGGLAAGLFSVLGMPGSYLGAWLTRARRPAVAFGLLGVVFVAGLAMLLHPGLAIAGAGLCGLCQGFTLAAALTFIAHQRHPQDVPAVSTLAQGAGYLLAAAGPVLLGALVGATGSFTSGNAVLVGMVALVTVTSVGVCRAERSPARQKGC